MRTEDTRTRILEAAWSVFVERGRKTTVGDVARASGISRQAVYLHFGSRQGLIVAALQHRDDQQEFGNRARYLFQSLPAKQALLAFVRLWTGYIPEIIELGLVLDGAALTDDDARAGLADRMASQHFGLLAAFESLEDEGQLRTEWTPTEAAEAVSSLIHFKAWEQLVMRRGWTPERFLESRLQIIEQAFLK